MDLVQTVRKEGSRGGRSDFKWEDVKSSTHRENYLGHSLMAPVGRWQKNKDLSWYANADGTQMDEAEARMAEMKRVKQAEDEAMAKALGIELPADNANMTALGGRPAQETPKETQAPRISEGRLRRRDGEEDRHRRRRRDRSEDDHDRRRYRRQHSREDRHGRRSRSRSTSRSPPRHRRRRSHSRDRYREDRPRKDEPRDRRSYDERDRRRSRSPRGPSGRY